MTGHRFLSSGLYLVSSDFALMYDYNTIVRIIVFHIYCKIINLFPTSNTFNVNCPKLCKIQVFLIIILYRYDKVT